MTLSVRLLKEGDEQRLDLFLAPHTPAVYFMRSNLIKAGLRYEGQVFQADYFGLFDGDILRGVLSHSWLGNMQSFCAEKDHIELLVKAWRARQALDPRPVAGILGLSNHVELLLAALGVAPSLLRGGGAPERLFTLDLMKMQIPIAAQSRDLTFRLAQSSDIDQLSTWRHDYNVEALGDAPGQATYDKGRAEMTRRVGDNGDLFILEHRGEIVSFCGVGGFLPDWKIIGPVWTPPAWRNRGYGRLVTALALQYRREEGATQAVLFTNTIQAEKAYRAIGFEYKADWRLDFLINPSSLL